MDVIDLKDYPRDQYSVYWEIAIDSRTFMWLARIYDYATNEVVQQQTDRATDMASARLASQTWVLGQMDQYKRA